MVRLSVVLCGSNKSSRMLNRDEEGSLTLALLLRSSKKIIISKNKKIKIEKYENYNDFMHADNSSNVNRQNTTDKNATEQNTLC